MPDDFLDRLRVDGDLDLDDHDPRETFGWDKATTKAGLGDELAALAELQKRLFAQERDAVLVVLQAMDAGGKDGTIRNVMTGLNPAGVRVWGFGVPSEEERSHDFLWRIHDHAPATGRITVFNRSHYEDVLVVRVKGLVPEARWRRRYEHIRNFEEMLSDEGTRIVKIFLNVSKDEQRERLQDRVDSPDERWKFRHGDLDDRALWDEYREAYTEAMVRTSTDRAPWYVVPADRKWVRNRTVTRLLTATLEDLDPQYPDPADDVAGVIVT